MNRFLSRITLYIIFLSLAVVAVNSCGWFAEKIDYNTQVKPIINKKCIACHGGVRAKAGFSLLFREEALAPTKSGKPAIIPGDPGNSELIRRITHTDPEERMPYKHEPLSAEEIAIFRDWIKQGANWGTHWAYIPLKPVDVPSMNGGWVKNEIDAFVLEKLEEQGLEHSEEAPKDVLLRRLSLDIIGMPAPDAIRKKFLESTGEAGYKQLVDDLLKSDFYGEKWATMWLDLARYADTRGYEADRSRRIWKYRDWVIDAFNDNKPYDLFLKEQFAGDLYPNPTDAQYIATAFHRNAMTNDEGGSDNEEFRTAAVLDRVNTTWTGILGTTFNCVQCHSHPYDPFRHEEYYQFLAYFNNSRDEDTEAEYPLLRQYDSSAQNTLLLVKEWVREKVSEEKSRELYTFLRTWQPTINSLQCDRFLNAALVSSWYAGLRKGGSCRLPDAPLENKQELMFRYVSGRAGGKLKIFLDSLGGKLWTTLNLKKTDADKVNWPDGWMIETFSVPPVPGRHDLYFQYDNAALKDRNETGVLFEWFRIADPFPGRGSVGYDSAYARFNRLMKAKVTTTPILVENPQALKRRSYVFERGNWLLKAKPVQASLPALFKEQPGADRIALANWLTSRNNPLTARVLVNRIWEQLFGTGIVETLEDFGSQGLNPSHQELLDWMAWTFMNEDNWDIKKLIRRIVTSATYRQSSIASLEAQQKDPSNKWLSHGARFRLSAEQLRDQALCISGKLNLKKYGPGIMPYQPPGVWSSPYNGDSWNQSKGDEQYRRAVYIYWKRSAAYPSTVTFDGPGRQFCIARRVRTNTPLQALTLLNDPAYLDLARQFAFRLKKEPGRTPQEQVREGYRQATGHEPTKEVLQALMKLYERSYIQFRNDPDKACAMVGVMDEHNEPATAAMIVVANTLLNLDEVIMKY